MLKDIKLKEYLCLHFVFKSLKSKKFLYSIPESQDQIKQTLKWKTK